MEASWTRLEDVLERLGSSWGVMWASWERLGGILCLIFRPKWLKFRYAILDVILQVIFDGFCLILGPKNNENSKIFRVFKINLESF